MVSGLAGACLGLGRNEQVPWPRGPSPGLKRYRKVFHPRTLTNVIVDELGDEGSQATRAFGQLPCGCGQHDAALPPAGEDRVCHALVCRDAQARRGADGIIPEREATFDEKLSRSARAAMRVTVQPLTIAVWRAVAEGRRRADFGEQAQTA